jgi:Mg2+-importing ATPase
LIEQSPQGLSEAQARERLAAHGPNELREAPGPSLARRFLWRLANPLQLVLIAASLIAALTGDAVSFGIVLVVVLMSAVLDLVQEHRADHAVQALQRSVALRVRVWRDGVCAQRLARELVPGDVVALAAGSVVPADAQVLQAHDFFVNQALLTGEAYPVEKRATPVAAASPNASLQAEDRVFMGSTVVSGTAQVCILATGRDTELGRLSHTLQQPAPLSEFERGTRRFGLLITRWTMALVLGVLLVNTLYHRPLLESFLFAVALAVGLTPELLPMILSVTLARGAVRLARQEVITKRLSAIHDLGAMDVLCTDKTGTLTEATLTLERSLGAGGGDDPRVLALGWLNSHFETGVQGALDDAILAQPGPDTAGWRKLDEVPFDFERRRVSVLLQREAGGERVLIVKGAPEDMLRLSVAVREGDADLPLDDAQRQRIGHLLDDCSGQGLRLLAVARRRIDDRTVAVSAADEHDLVLAGFLAFVDAPKPSTAPALRALQAHGVTLKIVTGDNEAVTRHLCASIGLHVQGVLTGAQIAPMDDLALRAAADGTNLFCRVTPAQKNRIVNALKARGHVVGYLGDGANDAPPLHSADVGISVDGAVDVAKQAADLVLLRHDLAVLIEGLREGRRTVLNVDKYVRMATSSNFGNMVSMALAALFLPFLPMRPLQILLNNFLYDVSELALPLDRVADAQLQLRQRWDIAAVRRFMLSYGPLSSLFDLAAFALLARVFHASVPAFQTAWFVQSIATQVLVVFVIRTPEPAWRDRPSPWVTGTSLAVTALALALPWLPGAGALGFVPLPPSLLGMIGALTLGYLAAADLLKRRLNRQPGLPAQAVSRAAAAH